MATDKLFNVAGVTKFNGEYKVRFATDLMRVKVLAKHGHEDIRLEPLATDMTKYDAILAIKDMDVFADAAAQSAIAEYLEEKAPKAARTAAPKATAAPKVKASKNTKQSREAQALAEAAAVAKQRALAEADDATF